MDIGRKIYFEKTNGIVIWDKGEMSGDVVETTFEQDCQTIPLLSAIEPTQLGVLQLGHGESTQEFAQCKGYKVNVLAETIDFIGLD